VAINDVYFKTPPLRGVEKKTSAAVSEMSLTGSFVTWSVVQAGIGIASLQSHGLRDRQAIRR